MQSPSRIPAFPLRRHRSRRGFTLIEIMVATAVMVVLVGLVIQITSQVLNVWNRSSGRLAANAEARIAMDLLTQDLETSVLRSNGQQWLRVEGPETTGGPYDDQTVALHLFSPALDRPKEDNAGNRIPGDIAAIAYRLKFKESYAGGEDVYALYRRIVDARTTFEDYLGSPGATDSPQLALTGTTGNADWSEGTVTDNDNYLASNIVEFKVLFYAEDNSGGSPAAELVNAEESGLSLKTGSFAVGGNADTVITRPLLYAEIFLKVVSDEGLELLQRFEETGGFGGYDNAEDIVREFGETFTRRVNFMSRPL